MFNQPKTNSSKRKTKLNDAADSIMCRWSAPSMSAGNGKLNTMAQMSRAIGKIRKNLNSEQKFLDQTSVPANCASDVPVVIALTPPAQGDTSSTRDGNSIKVTRIDLKLGFSFAAGGTGDVTVNNNQIFQWYLFRWKKTPTSSGSTPPSIGDIFLVDGNGAYTTNSLLNVNTNANYQLMANGTVDLEVPYWTISGTSDNSVNREIVDVVHNCEFHQYFSSTTAASITDNLVFMVILASSGGNGSTNNLSQYQLSARVWYVDN